MVRCTKAVALRQALRHVWDLPGEASFYYIGPDWLLVLLNSVNKETRANLMFLFSRVWHLRNDIIFGKGESLISTSVVFLQNYLTPMNPNWKRESSLLT
jgi:hypothetical protein